MPLEGFGEAKILMVLFFSHDGIKYYRNMKDNYSKATEPNFYEELVGDKNPFSVVLKYDYASPAFSDIDGGKS